jgi:hypothetical protein
MPTVVNQAFPDRGALARNLNLSLKLLQTIIGSQDGAAYGYIVDTVRCDSGVFVQTGSGPNFQGDLVMLWTCKHQMRSGVSLPDWKGAWVAGFTGVDVIPGHRVNYLVYLMKVRQAYASHRDLWQSLPEATRTAKAADLERLGDLYRPCADADPFDPASYTPPRPDHAHCHEYGWHTDVDYLSPTYHRRAPLLVGEPQYSFLWSKPLVAHPIGVHPRTKKHTLRSLLAELSNRPIRGG